MPSSLSSSWFQKGLGVTAVEARKLSALLQSLAKKCSLDGLVDITAYRRTKQGTVKPRRAKAATGTR